MYVYVIMYIINNINIAYEYKVLILTLRKEIV